ncbi:hypothetical protein [Synechococcus phage S-B68]|nr:hypothetical protein [Synechococcus phage S-B68]
MTDLKHDLSSFLSSSDWSAETLCADGTDAVVETVGAYIEEFMNSYGVDPDDDENEELYSDLCFMVYEFHGAEDLESGTPEWDAHWESLL